MMIGPGCWRTGGGTTPNRLPLLLTVMTALLTYCVQCRRVNNTHGSLITAPLRPCSHTCQTRLPDGVCRYDFACLMNLLNKLFTLSSAVGERTN